MGRKGTCTQIVRYSVESARAVVSEGGRIQPMAKRHAEVLDRDGNCVGYLTKTDYSWYLASVDSSAKDTK